MSTFLSILALLAVAISALIAVSIANHLYTREQIRRQKCLHLRRRVAELEEIALTLEPLVTSLVIPMRINEENLTLTRSALELEPNSQSLRAHLERAEALAADYADTTRPRELNRLLESDSAIARAMYYINEAIHVLRNQQVKGLIEMEELNTLVAELNWAHLMVQVVSLVGEGHKATQRGNGLSAHAFYRKAQQKLIDTVHSESRRHPLIRQMGEILAGTRSALSEELMPETRFNPPPRALAREPEAPSEPS